MKKLQADEAVTAEEMASAKAVPVAAVPHKVPFGRFLRILGPGIITGAADDDPSGIATYTQAGAGFGFATVYTMLVTYPLMTAVQETCMRIGAVTGKGLAAVIRENYPRWVLYPVIALVVLANVLNIGSDIGAMAASTKLIIPLPFPLLAIIFTLIMLALQIFVSYKIYVKMLKWLAVALLAYPITAFIVNVDWAKALHATITPTFSFKLDFIYIVVAILGTTISPYLFFWQTSEVVEDEIMTHRLAQKGGVPRLSKPYLRGLRIDNALGMLFSNVTAWFLIVVGATVLGAAGITNVNSAADAARALEPLVRGFPNAGLLAKVIFSVGIVGIGLLSVPVLAGSSSYAITEAFGWREGLFRRFRQAQAFYGVIIAATLLGLSFNFLGIDPIKALIFTAVFNGLAAVPLIFLVARIGGSERILGEHRSGFWSKLGTWSCWLVMTAAAGLLLYSLISQL